MPLVQGATPKAISANVKREVGAGRNRKQAIAIALSVAKKIKKKK